MATQVSQVKKIQLSDWFTDTYGKCSKAEHQLRNYGDVGQEAKFLSNETDCQTKWDQYATEVRLADHINHMKQWREEMEKLLRQLDNEIADLSETKETCENTLEFVRLRTDIAIECLTLREDRTNTELVQDESSDQLDKEMGLIERIKKSLHQKILESFEQLCLLQEVRQLVQTNLNDKIAALTIDVDQYNLSFASPNISYKTDAVRTPKGSLTVKEWDSFSNNLKNKAEAELKSSSRLRDKIQHFLKQSENEFEVQKMATEFAFRKRMHDINRAKEEMEWLKKNTEDAIIDLGKNIQYIHDSIKSKHRFIMTAQTRLENRSFRSNEEKCCDAVHFGLIDEAKQLDATIQALEEKHKEALHTLDGLQRSLARLTDDINIKNQTLYLDKQCMSIREKLNPKCCKVEKAHTLTGFEEKDMHLND